jgi:predicted RNA-binding protein YlxR (DUF448 family)
MKKIRKYYRKCGVCGERHEQSEMIRTNNSPNGWICFDCHNAEHPEPKQHLSTEHPLHTTVSTIPTYQQLYIGTITTICLFPQSLPIKPNEALQSHN